MAGGTCGDDGADQPRRLDVPDTNADRERPQAVDRWIDAPADRQRAGPRRRPPPGSAGGAPRRSRDGLRHAERQPANERMTAMIDMAVTVVADMHVAPNV